MSISQYIKEIGRGKDGSRALTRSQADDLLGQVLDGTVTDLEIGGFCLAMRIKGETPEELAGFLDALHRRLQRFPATERPTVVIPSYNGARKLPVLTPLLALLLARENLSVLVHGSASESTRVFTAEVFGALGIHARANTHSIAPGEVAFAPTDLLNPALKRLLDVRRVVGLRNPAHSLVKIMSPCLGDSVVLSSYTHPEYALSMAKTFELVQANAMLLRGTEGEAVADARRMPQMDGFVRGQRRLLQETQPGTLTSLPDLPKTVDASATAGYIRAVMDGRQAVPAAIARQVEHILHLVSEVELTSCTTLEE